MVVYDTLSTIFQLYPVAQFYRWRKLEDPEKTTQNIGIRCLVNISQLILKNILFFLIFSKYGLLSRLIYNSYVNYFLR